MRNSIKREQSQACLNFAERLRVGELCSGMRKNFRLQAKQKILMTLVLLIAAVGGAWAEETPLLTIRSTDYTSFKSGSMTFDDKVTVTFSNPVKNDGDSDGWFSENEPSLLTVTGTNGYTITSCKFYTISTINTGYTVEGESPSVYLYNDYVYTDASKSVTIGFNGIIGIVVYGAAPATGPEVIINDTKTEASFEMPQYDVTATYTIKRDISVDVTATMGDGTDGVRYRVKKDGNNKFIPADMEMAAVPALFTVNDAIEQKALTQTQDYIVQIYAIDAEGQPTGDPMTFATFTFEPGIYAVKAVAADGSDYAGETALSNTFKLFQGYEVQVAAKEFITYYKDEPLRVEDEAAELYTVSSVNDTQAVLSQKSDAMPSNTPMLVYNNSDETKVILLIPCNEPDLAITVAPEFQGTLTGTTIAASTENVTNYALNGKAFVFVKNAIEVGPNKAWLSINTGVPSARITIVFDDATKIANTNLTNLTNGDWYDLNGRKLDKMPTKKGVYLFNGRKVVVK